MTPNQEPINEGEIEALCQEMNEQREEIREALAEDIGGGPGDYRN